MVSGQRHTTAALPPEKNPDTHSTGGCVDLRPGADDLEKREVFYICGSVHHKSIILINQLDETVCNLIYSLLRFTVHVLGALYTNHQEYN
jgi:hypothetical protein